EINVSSLGCTKVLGSGNVATKLVVIAKKFSLSAKAKIEAAGGEAKLIESDVGETDKTADSSQAKK
ncbi:MAG: uL15 family ribosomal protein, partial [Candidatus Aenigmarchaeota archaeon]|nr:uL15 family ribosomal protein [Candidatus Aenigmarchaeota archaeon]